MRKYYISGLVGSTIPSIFVLVLVLWSLGLLLWAYALPVWLIGGFSAGYIGTRLEKNKTVSVGFGLVALTAILGFIFSFLLGLLFISAM